MAASQTFTRRIKDRVTPERTGVTFDLVTTDEDEEGNEVIVLQETYHADPPTEEQLLLAFAEAGRESSTIADEAGAMFDLLQAVLPADEYRRLKRRFLDPKDQEVTVEAISDIFQWLMEQWQDFPTQPRNGSSASQNRAGRRSTGRAPSKGSTR